MLTCRNSHFERLNHEVHEEHEENKENKYKKLKIVRKLIIKWIKKHIEELSFLFFLRDLRVLRGKIRIAAPPGSTVYLFKPRRHAQRCEEIRQ